MMLCTADFDELFPPETKAGIDRWEDDGGRVPAQPKNPFHTSCQILAQMMGVALATNPAFAIWGHKPAPQ